jgi:hypothetical protein
MNKSSKGIVLGREKKQKKQKKKKKRNQEKDSKWMWLKL